MELWGCGEWSGGRIWCRCMVPGGTATPSICMESPVPLRPPLTFSDWAGHPTRLPITALSNAEAPGPTCVEPSGHWEQSRAFREGMGLGLWMLTGWWPGAHRGRDALRKQGIWRWGVSMCLVQEEVSRPLQGGGWLFCGDPGPLLCVWLDSCGAAWWPRSVQLSA